MAADVGDMDMGGEGEGRSKAKYMKLLRRIANRQTTEVVIDLSDLKKVYFLYLQLGMMEKLTISSPKTPVSSTTFSKTPADMSRSSAKLSTR